VADVFRVMERGRGEPAAELPEIAVAADDPEQRVLDAE
jgi:hypothetical protein